MSYKKLEKAVILYEKLKSIDKEIIDIEKLAILVADNPCSITLSLSIVDIAKRDNEQSKAEFDEDGSIKNSEIGGIYRSLMSSYLTGFIKEENKDKSTKYTRSYNQDISDTTTLSVLGVMLFEKQSLRSKIVSEIKSLNLI